MTQPPVPNDRKAAAIRIDHPQWVDNSIVTYSWAGLCFPIPAVSVDEWC
jgi:hypothetical protein